MAPDESVLAKMLVYVNEPVPETEREVEARGAVVVMNTVEVDTVDTKTGLPCVWDDDAAAAVEDEDTAEVGGEVDTEAALLVVTVANLDELHDATTRVRRCLQHTA